MAIIEYDHSPNISSEQRLRSLADSVRRAFEELEQGNKTEKEQIDEHIKQETDITPIYINKLKKSVSIGEVASDEEHELFNVAWDARFKGDIEIAVDSEFEELYTAVFGSGGVVRLLDMIFHIGYVIPTTNSRFDPNVIYPWQIWERYARGQTLVGVNEDDATFASAGLIGGEKTHKLTVDEMPSHNHTATLETTAGKLGGGSTYSRFNDNGTPTSGIVNIGKTGDDQAHNNLQPYTTVYYWRRTA